LKLLDANLVKIQIVVAIWFGQQPINRWPGVVWAETVANLLDASQRLSALPEKSRAFAENYSVEKITEKLSRLYRRVVFLGQSENV